MEDEEEVNKSVGEEEGEWRITTTTGGGDHHHAHIVTVMSAEELEGGGGTTTATFVPVTFDTGGRGGTGEVRLIQVPISMLPPNFHFLHSTQSQQHDSSTQQILTQGGSQGEQLAVTLVTTTQSDESERDLGSGVIHEEHDQEEFMDESITTAANVLAPPAAPQPSVPSLRSRRSRPIRKHVDTSFGSLKKEEEKSTNSGEEGGAGKFVGPQWPEDRCANCAVEFKEGEASEGDQSVVQKSSHLKAQEGEEDVSNHEALQHVFNIRLRSGRGKDASDPNELCWLCGTCSSVLEELYTACRAFTKLTKEEAFLYKRLRSKVIQTQKSKEASDPPFNSFEAVGSKVEVKLEVGEYAGEDEEEDEWITGDLSDDEDFRASPTDLEKAEVSSESSESESTDQYHTYGSNKRKSKTDLMASGSPKKKKGRKNKTGGSFWWDSNMKTDSDDDESNLGFYKRNKKLRVKKSLLTGITYDCSACEASTGASFASPRELKIHLRESHREVGTVTDIDTIEGSTILTEGTESEGKASATSCRLCSFQVFPSVGEFKDHWAKDHGEANISSSEVLPYECFTCKRTFVEWTALIKHRIMHNLQRPYKCRLCGESWRRADELQVHWSNTHVQDFMNDNATSNAGSDGSTSKKDESLPPAKRREAVPCSVCGKAFIRHDHLKLHMRIHTGEKPFPCPTCGKAFSDPRGLAYHEVTHSSERPYCCTVCGMTFKRLHHLNDHERNHASDVARPFSCELCGKAFKYKKHLNSHSVIHGNNKDHSCEICHKAFNRKDNLRQHVKKVHGKEPGPDTMSSGGGGLVHHSLVSSLEGGGEEEDVLVGDEPEVSINEEGTVRSGHVEVPTATAIPIVTGSGGEGLAVDHIVYMTL